MPPAETLRINPRTLQFLLFAAVSLASIWAGYTARRRGWLREDASRAIHFYTFVVVWSMGTFLGLWMLIPRAEHLWYLVLQPLIMIVGAYGIIPIAHRVGCNRQQTGVLALAAGQGNNGATLGAYLCYCLLDPPEQAFGLGIALVAIMQGWAVFLIFPIARRFGEGAAVEESFLRLVRRSFLDVRAMTFYAALLGLTLSLLSRRWPGEFPRGLAFPRALLEYRVVDAVIYASGIGAYFGIGLRLRLGDSLRNAREHALLAATKFVVVPLAAAALLWGVHQTPWPLPEVAWRVFLVESMIPAAIATVILSNLFHLDARLASVVWLWNTLIFLLVPLPLLVWWLR